VCGLPVALFFYLISSQLVIPLPSLTSILCSFSLNGSVWEVKGSQWVSLKCDNHRGTIMSNNSAENRTEATLLPPTSLYGPSSSSAFPFHPHPPYSSPSSPTSSPHQLPLPPTLPEFLHHIYNTQTLHVCLYMCTCVCVIAASNHS